MHTPHRRSVGRHRRSERDRGSVVLIAMVLTLVLSSVAAGLAGYAAISLRATRVTENRADQLASADAAIRYAVEKLRLRQTLCTTAAGVTGLPVSMADPLNDATVSVSCRRIGTGIGDIQGWAAVITSIGLGSDPGLTSQGGSGQTKLLGGPVYVNDLDTVDLEAPVRIEQGDLWYQSSDCTAPAATPTDLTFEPPVVRGLICTDETWDSLFPAPALPASPPPVAPAPTTVDGCKVFSPGTYTSEPELDGFNYFKSGEYYFDDIGTWSISHAVVVGGMRGGAPLGDLVSYIPQGVCATVGPLVGESGASTGVTFYMGGNSAIEISTQGQIELHRRKSADGKVAPSVLAVPAGAGGGWTPSTLTGLGDPIIETKSGGVSDLVSHGMVYAPKAALVLGNVTADANGQLLGGVVIARLELQASASATAFNIRVETSPVKVLLLITATASKGTGAATRVQSLVELRMRQDAILGVDNEIDEVAVSQWRVCATALAPSC